MTLEKASCSGIVLEAKRWRPGWGDCRCDVRMTSELWRIRRRAIVGTNKVVNFSFIVNNFHNAAGLLSDVTNKIFPRINNNLFTSHSALSTICSLFPIVTVHWHHSQRHFHTNRWFIDDLSMFSNERKFKTNWKTCGAWSQRRVRNLCSTFPWNFLFQVSFDCHSIRSAAWSRGGRTRRFVENDSGFMMQARFAFRWSWTRFSFLLHRTQIKVKRIDV